MKVSYDAAMWYVLAGFLAGFVGLVGWLVWANRAKRVWRVEVSGGRAAVVMGQPDERFVKDVEQICGLWGIDEGVVEGYQQGERVRLRCAGPIAQQQHALQNALDHPIG